MGAYFDDTDDVARRVQWRDRLIVDSLLRRGRPFAGRRIADVGCGFHAATSRRFLGEAASLTLVDRSVSPALRAHPTVEAVEGTLPAALERVADESVDIVICSAVLEHLEDPAATLAHLRRIVAPGGCCLIAVPTWTAKPILEFLAFRIRLSDTEAIAMDEHRMYYAPRDLWPLLVRTGFLPSEIRCYRHWLRLNTFAVCRKSARPAARDATEPRRA
jgi:ubiquinone/menaquinone biosynthesis C-methylase UbiE